MVELNSSLLLVPLNHPFKCDEDVAFKGKLAIRVNVKLVAVVSPEIICFFSTVCL